MASNTSRQGWLYQGHRINTQTNAGGGALTTRISVPAGMIARLVSMMAIGTASAGATLRVVVQDEDSSEVHQIATVAAGASRVVYLPSIGSAASATNNVSNSTGYLLGPGQFLVVASSAALQNETQEIFVALLLYNVGTAPTWDTTGSAGTPSLAASTISTANTLTPLVVNPP